jgi:hypothetical protein
LNQLQLYCNGIVSPSRSLQLAPVTQNHTREAATVATLSEDFKSETTLHSAAAGADGNCKPSMPDRHTRTHTDGRISAKELVLAILNSTKHLTCCKEILANPHSSSLDPQTVKAMFSNLRLSGFLTPGQARHRATATNREIAMPDYDLNGTDYHPSCKLTVLSGSVAQASRRPHIRAAITASSGLQPQPRSLSKPLAQQVKVAAMSPNM